MSDSLFKKTLSLREASRQAHLIAAKQMESYLDCHDPDDKNDGMTDKDQMKLDLYIVNIIRYHYWRAGQVRNHWENKSQELKKELSK